MSAKTIKELDADARKLVTDAKAILVDRDNRTPEEVQGALKSLDDAHKIVEDLEKLTGIDSLKTINRIENSLAALKTGQAPYLGGGGDGATLVGGNGRDHMRRMSFGEYFVSNPQYTGWLKTMTGGSGHFPRQQFTSPALVLPSALSGGEVEMDGLKTLLYAGGSTSGGPLVWSDQRRDIVADTAPFRQFTIRQLITTLQTSSDSIEYVRITSKTNNAATVAEASATGGSTGAKPESAMTFTTVTDSVQTIAHWIPATTRVLQDAPQLRGIIDQFLRQGLEEKLEDQILTGDGAGTNFTGINTYTGTLTQSYSTNLLTTTRKARTKIRVDGKRIPNGWVMHPNAWEDIDLLVDNESRYYFGGPLTMGTPRLWGLPVVESEGQTEITILLGDFRQAVLWDRMQTMVSVGNQHSDFFVRNMVAVLAEMRAGFGILDPEAFVKVSTS